MKKLCERGIFKNKKSIVSSIISRDEYYAIQSESFVEETFDGSLPAFIAAFSKRKKLSAEEVAQLKSMVDAYGEE
ncbi:MAG: BlaI/MecI/CopY family transcriptional regulator [Lachnospiraceae bacterium]|nr:BlaI/MecI/CopY family transcriptional regulator [Lachnospiraceae bacterium]